MLDRDMTALELSPYMNIAQNLISEAQRINSCREASTRLAHGVQDGPPALADLSHGTQDGPPAAASPPPPPPPPAAPPPPASQQGQRVEHEAHGAPPGVLPQLHTSLGWPRDGERILWDSDRLACVWRHVQRCHIQQEGPRLDLEGLVGELGLRHPQQRYNEAVRRKYHNLASKFDSTGVTPSLEGGRPKYDLRRLPFRLSDKVRQVLASMPGCEGSYEDITKALEEEPEVRPHVDRRICYGFK